jgi:hypothetical protein
VASLGRHYTPSALQSIPYSHAAHVSPDGTHAAFISTAPLSGYDNTGQRAGEPDAEVFVYDAGSDELRCVSCDPSGARPRAARNIGAYGAPVRGKLTEYPESGEPLWAAATLPGWQSQLYESRPLSEDGSRLFFNSYEALVPRDTNGREDVYEWEAAGGEAACKALGAELYVASAGGCISLISSGRDPKDSEFVDADRSGDNVFIRTTESLLPQDPGLIDIYDARVGGGFPPPSEAPECEGEACQPSPSPPAFQTPSSSSFEGAAGSPRPRDCRPAARRALRLSRRARHARHALGRAPDRRTARRLHRRARRLALRARRLSRNAKRCRRADRRAAR